MMAMTWPASPNGSSTALAAATSTMVNPSWKAKRAFRSARVRWLGPAYQGRTDAAIGDERHKHRQRQAESDEPHVARREQTRHHQKADEPNQTEAVSAQNVDPRAGNGPPSNLLGA